MRTFQQATATIAAVAALALTAACGGGSDGTDEDASGSGSTDPTADLVGPACAEYAASNPDGPGSIEGMAQDPLVMAAGSNPLLRTFTSAVSGQLNPEVNLVDTLNGGELTVFAPVDPAFNDLPKRTVNQLGKGKNAGTLTDILTYHVVEGRMAPGDIEGEQSTVNGATLTVSGSGDSLVVNDNATVVCGGIRTRNATVYLVDTVLMPPSA